jgi:hypothetical protein
LASGTAQATLPWSWYSDPQMLPREQERIFRRGWQYVGGLLDGGQLLPQSERLLAHFQELVREAPA